jgi:hypothetical protein
MNKTARQEPRPGGWWTSAAAVILLGCFPACDTAPDQAEEPSALAVPGPVAPVTSGQGPADVCVGVPDGASPIGCDRLINCVQQECAANRCVVKPTPGVPCGGRGVKAGDAYVCDSAGACVAAQGEASPMRR